MPWRFPHNWQRSQLHDMKTRNTKGRCSALVLCVSGILGTHITMNTPIDPVSVIPNPEAMREVLNAQLRKRFRVNEDELATLRTGVWPDTLRRRIVIKACFLTLLGGGTALFLIVASLRIIQIALQGMPAQMIAAVLFLAAAGFLLFVARKSARNITNPELEQVLGVGYTRIQRGTQSSSSSSGPSRTYILSLSSMQFGLSRDQYELLEDGQRLRAWYLKAGTQLIAIEALQDQTT